MDAAVNERISFRVKGDIKRQIEDAARLMGQSLTEFAVSVLAREAMDIKERHYRIVLTDRERDAFLAALDSDEEVEETPSLARAFDARERWLG